MKHKYFQQALTNENTFTECEAEKATHFLNPATGDYESISKLLLNSTGNKIHLDVNGNEVVSNVPKNDVLPEPLLMPAMNFNEEDDVQIVQNDFDGLPMPKMTFNEPKKDKANIPPSDDVLPLPVMKF